MGRPVPLSDHARGDGGTDGLCPCGRSEYRPASPDGDRKPADPRPPRGTHLLLALPDLVDQTAAILDQMGVEQVVACHCTGFRALSRLAQRLGERVVPGTVGGRWTF